MLCCLSYDLKIADHHIENDVFGLKLLKREPSCVALDLSGAFQMSSR